MSDVPVLDQVQQVKLAAVIPWLGGQPDRQQNLDYVRKHYQEHMPIFVGSGATLGECRNRGAIAAMDAGYDMIFFVDGDMVLPVKSVTKAADLALLTGGLVYPYGQLTRLYKWERESFLRGCAPPQRHSAGEAGALVVSAEGFKRIHGYPHLSSQEDNILHNVAAGLLGPATRYCGPAIHLWHEPSARRQDDRALQVVYKTEAAVNNPDQIEALVKASRYYDLTLF